MYLHNHLVQLTESHDKVKPSAYVDDITLVARSLNPAEVVTSL